MEKDWQHVIFILVVSVLAFFLWYSPYGNVTAHAYPVQISSGDANSRLSEAEWTAISSEFLTLPPWFSDVKGSAQVQPPIHLIVAASLSQLGGFPIWDVFYFLGALVWIGTAIVFYFLFAHVWNDRLTGALTALLVVYPLQEIYRYQFNIGMYHTHYTIVFYALALFVTARILAKGEWSWKSSWRESLLLGFILGTQFLIHGSETVPLVIGIGAVFLVQLFLKNRKGIVPAALKFLPIVLSIALVMLVMILPYLPLFWGNFIQGTLEVGFKESTPGPITAPPWEPTNTIFTFLPWWALVIFLIGAVVSATREKYRPLVIMWVVYAIIDYILTQFGIGQYYISIRGRNMMYLLAYPLVALGISTIIITIKQTVQKAMHREPLGARTHDILFWGATLVLAIVLVGQGLAMQPRQGLFSQNMYAGFEWLRDHTPEQSRVMCVLCNQYIGLPSHRVIMEFNINPESMQHFQDLIAGVSANRTFTLQYSGYSDQYLLRKGLFGFENRLPIARMRFENDLCGFDYFALVPFIPQSQQALQGFASRLLAKNSSVVYVNSDIAIIKNAHVGGACI